MSAATKTHTESRTSLCDTCELAVEISIVVPGQRWNDGTWRHLDPTKDQLHNAWPEMRAAIDATCPACKYPEIGYAFARGEFVCSRCDHVQTDRPAA